MDKERKCEVKDMQTAISINFKMSKSSHYFHFAKISTLAQGVQKIYISIYNFRINYEMEQITR
jgi:hypothetical protein